MKVLHCTSFLEGGAGIAAYRLHNALQQSNLCASYMGVRKKNIQDDSVLELASPLDVFLTRCSNLLLRTLKKNTQMFYSYYALPNDVAQKIATLQPDIIHLHWIANFMSPYTLRQLATLNIPVVWTLHDTWAFTGGCHYGKCVKWQEHCQKCPLLKSIPYFDVSHIHWKAKKRAYAALQSHIVCPSIKMQQKATQSSLLQNATVSCVPNTLDTTVFTLQEKNSACQTLGIPPHMPYILFGAMSAASDPNKGYDLLKDALSHLPDEVKKNTHCLIFGASAGEELPLPSTFLGYLDDTKKIAAAYAAADVFVCPSREESFSNTTLEALACGTPVVGFNIGGIPDMVSHKESGYIATPYDTQDLAYGISYTLKDHTHRKRMGQWARKAVEERYAYPIVAKQYMALYQEIVQKHKS